MGLKVLEHCTAYLQDFCSLPGIIDAPPPALSRNSRTNPGISWTPLGMAPATLTTNKTSECWASESKWESYSENERKYLDYTRDNSLVPKSIKNSYRSIAGRQTIQFKIWEKDWNRYFSEGKIHMVQGSQRDAGLLSKTTTSFSVTSDSWSQKQIHKACQQ